MKKSILTIVTVILVSLITNVGLTFGQVKHSFNVGQSYGVMDWGLDSNLIVNVGDTIEFVNDYSYGKFKFTTNTPSIDGNGTIITYTNTGDTIKTFVLTDTTSISSIQVWFKDDPTIYVNLSLTYNTTITVVKYINSNKENTIVKMYPNPTTGLLNLTETVKTVDVYNTNGQLVLSEANTNHLELNLSNGVYIVKTFSENGSINTNRIQVLNELIKANNLVIE